MKFSEHCNLCENEITDFEKGLICGLTNLKPEFNRICSRIELNHKFKEKIDLINLELERIKRNKKSVHLKFYILIIIGFIFIIGANPFVKRNPLGVYSTYYLFGIISMGITLLSIAYNILNKFRRELRNSYSEKEEIDNLLKMYNIEYKIEFDFEKEIHGNQKVTLISEFKNWKEKQTKETYEIKFKS